MAERIRRVAVLGAGVMGSGIAAHLANAGIESVLYDMVPKDAKDSSDPKARSAMAIKGIAALKKSKPPQLYRTDYASRITPANYDDHADLLKTCDWIVEVVVERLDIKKKVFQWVADNRREGSIVSSNTSGIPLASMVEDMSDEMKQHFLVTHFFNPVRYMRLLELVSGPDTLPEITATMADFGERVLGKGIVHGKDTPNFVANRIGTYGMASVFHHMVEMGMTVEQIDAIFGSAMGRPKSAVFRTADIVGLDTLVHVFGTVYDSCVSDEQREAFLIPGFVKSLVDSGRTGQKTGAGFYKKMKKDGRSVIYALDTETLEYREKEKVRFPSIGKARNVDTAAEKVRTMIGGDDEASRIAWKVTADTLVYSANRIPEIADDVLNVDRGMRWGFGWDLGPFEIWDAIGVKASVERMKEEGREVPQWVQDMLAAGRESFYARDDSGALTFWGRDGKVETIVRSPGQLLLSDVKANKDRIVERNPSASLVDIGDGALLLEFHSKMNALDELIFEQYERALDKLDAGEFEALVVGNQGGKAFCAGANVLMILMGAMQQQWDQIEGSIERLQKLMMRAKYSDKPVVTAPYGLTLGGGAEATMHSAATVANGELYMGLVEVGVGLIPGAGGCKEMVIRAMGDIPQDIDYDPNPFVQKIFERIGLAKVAGSAAEAQAWGFLRPTDRIVLDADRVIGEAKKLALGLAAGGYTPPAERSVKLPGPTGAAAIELFLYQMQEGGYATEHDVTVGKRLAYVLTGGDIPFGSTRTEWELLELERESFLSLCGEAKSQARMQHMLQKGKPLRN